jgi:hypothetical protein
MAAPYAGPTFAELFTPKLVTVLREGYGLWQLKPPRVRFRAALAEAVAAARNRTNGEGQPEEPSAAAAAA